MLPSPLPLLLPLLLLILLLTSDCRSSAVDSGRRPRTAGAALTPPRGARGRDSGDGTAANTSPGGNSTTAFFPEGGGVTMLTWDNWQAEVVKDEESGWFVMVCAPWCNACNAMKGDFEVVSRTLGGIVKVGAIDSDAEYKLSVLYKGEGYPALWYFPAGPRRAPVQYLYRRDVAGMVNFVLGMLPNHIVQIKNGRQWTDFNAVEPSAWPRAVLFTLSAARPVTHRALAWSMRRRALVGQVIHSEETKAIFQVRSGAFGEREGGGGGGLWGQCRF